jgi:hypothetical protein
VVAVEPPYRRISMGSTYTIRPERAADAAAVRAVNTAAFGRAAEADIVDRLRAHAPVYLGLVAVDGENTGRPHPVHLGHAAR